LPIIKGFNKYKIIGEIAEFYVVRRDGTKVTFTIDVDDLPKLIKLNYCWNAVYNEIVDNYYAVSTQYKNRDENGIRKQKTVLLTEIIANDKPIDHIDNDTKNNRKSNLRKTIHKTNATNRKSRNINNKSGFRNVSWSDNRWIVQLQIEGKNTILKRFKPNELEEAGAYAEEMREKYYGEFKGKN